jgi:hypothetical protein
MATYQMIQDRVKAEAGFVPATSWIAEVKASYGLDASEAANRGHRQSGLKPCPPEKQPANEALCCTSDWFSNPTSGCADRSGPHGFYQEEEEGPEFGAWVGCINWTAILTQFLHVVSPLSTAFLRAATVALFCAGLLGARVSGVCILMRKGKSAAPDQCS